MTILLLLVHGGGELHPLTPFANFGAQKHGAQALLYGARTDFPLPGYFLAAAALHQQPQDLRVARSYFYVGSDLDRTPSILAIRGTCHNCAGRSVKYFEGVLVLKRADRRITGNNNRIIGLGFV